MRFLTDFADQAVILPVALLVLAGLAGCGWPRAALAWAITIPAVLAVVAAAKMGVAACGAGLPAAWELRSPSGHTASAALVYGGLACLLIAGRRRGGTALLCAGTAASVAGLTRLALGVHTPADVLAGGALGIAGAVVLTWLAGPRPASWRVHWMFVLALALALLLLHGLHMRAEAELGAYARLIWPFTLCRP